MLTTNYQQTTMPSAARAIEHLSVLQTRTDVDHVAFWVSPNMILTLAGARGYADGVFYSEDQVQLDQWANQIQNGIDILSKTTEILIHTVGNRKTAYEESFITFDILFGEGFENSIAHTKLIHSVVLDQIHTTTSFEQFFSLLKTQTNTTTVQSTNPDIIEHIAHGVILGYPDIAIENYYDERYETDKFAPALIDADIRGASYYDCPRPIYSYHRNLISDPTIVTHEKLWSQILTDYYRSDFHRSLEADDNFTNKLKEIGSLL